LKRHLNTLYVTTQGAYLATKGQTVVVRVEKETRLRVPLLRLDGIVCFGTVSCSPELMARSAEAGVGISFLTERGRFLARVEGPVSGNVLLRREQFRRADDPEGSTDIARALVTAKIANSRTVLQRAVRDHKSTAAPLNAATEALAQTARRLQSAGSLEEIRGIEGEAARAYFDVFEHLIVRDKGSFPFRGRNRRPPTDRVNALLGFIYTLLMHDVSSALSGVGLDHQVGFLHRDRPGRSSLALDIMEELRAPLADRLMLSLINRGQVRPSGFDTMETGAVWMDDDTRKAVLVAYQERKTTELVHPFLQEKTTVGMIAHIQAMLLARFLRGDLDGYPAFITK
jgi:CRISPR-associated protein Cas1